MGGQQGLKNLVRRLWLQVRRRVGLKREGHTAPEEEVDIAVMGVESLYADPEHINLEEFSGMTEHLVAFGANGPVIAVTHQSLDAAVSHATAHLDVEVGGICLGRVFRSQQDDRLLIRIEEMIKAEHTVAGGAYLTFTPEAWRRLVDVHLCDFPDMRLLGWYHSHPGIGVFLSSMDRFIHDSFFTASWHVAVVIDPVQQQAGVFARYSRDLLLPGVLWWADDRRSVRQLLNDNSSSGLRRWL